MLNEIVAMTLYGASNDCDQLCMNTWSSNLVSVTVMHS